MKKKKYTIGILDYSDAVSAKSRYKKEVAAIKKSIKELGHTPKIYSAYRCQLYFDNKELAVYKKSKPVSKCDVLIPRFFPGRNLDLEVSIIKQFQSLGIPVINKYLPTLNAKNKLRTMQILTKRAIPVPKTVVVRKFEYLDNAINTVGGYPVVIKSAFGSLGSGVVIVESRRSMYSALDMLVKSMNASVLMIQEYVAESNGEDYRAFVVGDKVVAAMRRKSETGDFRSNIHLGGVATKVELTPQEKKLAINAVKVMDLDVGGVDILRSTAGPVIMEVNSNPGLWGIMSVSKKNIPEEIVKHAVSSIKK